MRFAVVSEVGCSGLWWVGWVVVGGVGCGK